MGKIKAMAHVVKTAATSLVGIVKSTPSGVHEEKLTLTVDVFAPDHSARTETPLFEKTRLERLALDNQRCYICNRTAEESGHPLEAHHFAIERQFAEGDIDWDLVQADFPHFDWSKFDKANPYTFVDDMMTQGMTLCKEHHTGAGTGIHFMPYSFWIIQRYLKAGYQYTTGEVIEHVHV